MKSATSEALYNTISGQYNLTRQADSYISKRLLSHLCPHNNEVYLDIGCGTGNYTIRLAEKGVKFCGVEPSDKMLDEAISKSDKVKWLIGSAELIPSVDNEFGGAIAVLTIHHWRDIEKSFKELSRVLKNDSYFVVFTSTPLQMNRYWLNAYFPK